MLILARQSLSKKKNLEENVKGKWNAKGQNIYEKRGRQRQTRQTGKRKIYYFWYIALKP
jgi:hypothetical protein